MTHTARCGKGRPKGFLDTPSFRGGQAVAEVLNATNRGNGEGEEWWSTLPEDTDFGAWREPDVGARQVFS